MAPPCERFDSDLSGFVDGTLGERRSGQVSAHLMDCPSCCDEVASLAALRAKLGACRSSAAPSTLTAKLESIAGEEASAPLYLSNGRSDLPSARRSRAVAASAGSVAFLAAMLSVMVLAVLIAPEPTRLQNPIKSARQQFAMSAAAISVNEALGAVLLAVDRGAELGATISYEPRVLVGDLEDVQSARAVQLLHDASQVSLSYWGQERVWISDGDGYHDAEVLVTKEAETGSQLEVLDASGSRFSTAFLPTAGDPVVTAPDSWTFQESTQRQTIAGRDATALVGSEDGQVVARWWFDTQTGLLLWSERYDTDGQVTLAAGFTDLSLGQHLLNASPSTELVSLQPATSSGTEGWCIGLTHCPESIGGLPLAAYSSSTKEGASAMTLVYSDGFETAVVGWVEGVLGESSLRADSAVGLPSVEMWQAGKAVVWVSTNGSRALLGEICEELPAQSEYFVSWTDRVAAGLQRLIPAG